jgi:hypothetical protein
MPPRDLPIVLHDLLEEIARLQAEQADPIQIGRLADEYRRLRAEL